MLNLNPTLTAAGLALFSGQSPNVKITNIAFGAQKYDPDGTETALRAELARYPVDGAAVITSSIIQVGVLMKNNAPDGKSPNNSWIGEIGFFVGATLFAVLSHAQANLFYKTPDIDIPLTYILDFSLLPPGSVTVNNDALSESISLAASYAQAAAKTSVDTLTVIKNAYYGTYAIGPVTRPDGTPRQKGDRYYDTSVSAEMTWNGNTWYVANLDAARLAEQGGAYVVGYPGGNVGKALDALTANASQLSGETSDQLGAISMALITGMIVVEVDAVGDSTFWGADPANLGGRGVSSPEAMQNFVNLFYGSNKFQVNNLAISGTTVTQMIAGTDGSGSTFDAKMAVSRARAVLCNHGVNDAMGVNETSAEKYKIGLVAFVKTCRKYGKTPILVTPYVSFAFGHFGSWVRAERQNYFAQIVRDVASEYRVTLVDNYRALEGMLASGKYRPLDLLPDAVHAAQDVYYKMGHNLTAPFIGSMQELSGPDQFMPAAKGNVLATQQTAMQTDPSRFGILVGTQDVGHQTIRMVFNVTTPGLDIYMAHPIWGNGSSWFVLGLDGRSVGTISMKGFSNATQFIHDHEILIAKNIDVGMHVIHIDVPGNGGLGIYYLRTRRAEPARLAMGNTGTKLVARKLLAKSISLEAGAEWNNIALREDMPCSRVLDDYECEFSARFEYDSGFILSAIVYGAGDQKVPSIGEGIMLAVDAAGRLRLYEETGPSQFTNVSIDDAVNYTLAEHAFRLVLTKSGTGANGCGILYVYVDDVLKGSFSITVPYFGGCLGLWKNHEVGTLTIKNLTQVLR